MIDERIANVLSVFEKLKAKSVEGNSPKFKLRISINTKKNSQFLLEYTDENENKIKFTILVDPLVKKIDVSINRNSANMLRCEYRKKLQLVNNSIPSEIKIPFLADFAPYIL